MERTRRLKRVVQRMRSWSADGQQLAGHAVALLAAAVALVAVDDILRGLLRSRRPAELSLNRYRSVL